MGESPRNQAAETKQQASLRRVQSLNRRLFGFASIGMDSSGPLDRAVTIPGTIPSNPKAFNPLRIQKCHIKCTLMHESIESRLTPIP